MPAGMALEDLSDQRLYVADAGHNRVLRLDLRDAASATILLGAAGRGRRLDQLARPLGLALLGSDLFVSDSGNSRLLRLRLGGASAELCLGGKGSGLSKLNEPYGLCSHAGLIYVADFGNHRVLSWRPGDESAELVFGRRGRGEGPDQLCCPSAVAVQGDDAMFVADFWNHRVLRLTRRHATAWEVSSIIAGVCGLGRGPGQLNGPRDLAVDGAHVLVADWGNNRVLRVRRDGSTAPGEEQVLGATGSLFKLDRPRGIVVCDGRVYITDSEHHRIIAM